MCLNVVINSNKSIDHGVLKILVLLNSMQDICITSFLSHTKTNISGQLTYARLGVMVYNGSIKRLNNFCWESSMPWEQCWIMEMKDRKKK